MSKIPPKLKRILVLLPMGAGWLAILGNSPPPALERTITGQSGPISITLIGDEQPNCSVHATLSAPVRRAAWSRDGKLIDEIVCIDGSDCIGQVALPIRTLGSLAGICHRVEVDGGAMSHDAGAAATDTLSDRRWTVDEASDDAPAIMSDAGDDAPAIMSDAGDDAPATVSDAAAIAGDAAAIVGDAPAVMTDAGGVASASDAGPDASPSADARASGPVVWPPTTQYAPDLFECQHTGIVRSVTVWDGCYGGSHGYKLEVETAAGVRSTIDYHIEEIPPKGYFGC